MFIVKSITDVAYVTKQTGDLFAMDGRSCNGLVLMHRGEDRYHQGESRVTATPDKVIFLPAGASYTLTCQRDSYAALVNFTGDIGAKEVFAVDTKQAEKLWEAFDRLLEVYQNDTTGYRTMSLFYALLGEVFPNPAPEHRAPARIRPSVAYLMEHYWEPGLDNQLLARQSNISCVYFRKVFTAHFGEPPMAYVRRLRLRRAETLLTGGAHSVEDVAYLCGYGSVYAFSNTFKKAKGCSPSAYIRRHSLI